MPGAFSTINIRKIRFPCLLWTQKTQRVGRNWFYCLLGKILNESVIGWQMVRAQSFLCYLSPSHFPVYLYLHVESLQVFVFQLLDAVLLNRPSLKICGSKANIVCADSPRIYVSTNPWKISSTFQTISTTRQEYMTVIENLKATALPEPKKGQKRLRPEILHLALIKALEDRIDAIDAESVVSGCSCWRCVVIGTSSMIISFCSADPVLICCTDDFYSAFKK